MPCTHGTSRNASERAVRSLFGDLQNDSIAQSRWARTDAKSPLGLYQSLSLSQSLRHKSLSVSHSISCAKQPMQCASCVVCYEHHPSPIQTGCACRGSNGWAHTGCLERAALVQQVHRGDAVWGECQTCLRAFSGEMLVHMAEAWVSACATVADPIVRCRAHCHLSTCRLLQGRYADAEQLNRDWLAQLTRELGAGHLQTMVCTGDLALSMSFMRKFPEANRLFGDATRALTATHGAHHPDTLLVQCNYVSSLLLQGRWFAAERLARSTVDVLRCHLGETHAYTMACVGNLAKALSKQGKHAEAGDIHRRLIATHVRVLGVDHPDTLKATRQYAMHDAPPSTSTTAEGT